MAKVDLKITLYLKGEDTSYKDMLIDDMDESLEDIISELVPDKKIKYKASMENFVTGVKIEKSN